MIQLLPQNSMNNVALYGGTTPIYTPNPIAAGYPTNEEPVIMDVSMSTTTNGMGNRQRSRGERMPHPWIKTSKGKITDDPTALFTHPPGSILPLGGVDCGHKGFALGLLVEMLSSSLAGYGRADGPTKWGASVFVQVLDPEAFGGLDAFRRESQWMVDACRNSSVAAGDPPVRLPGQKGLLLRRNRLETGVDLDSDILELLLPWTQELGVPLPHRVGNLR